MVDITLRFPAEEPEDNEASPMTSVQTIHRLRDNYQVALVNEATFCKEVTSVT